MFLICCLICELRLFVYNWDRNFDLVVVGRGLIPLEQIKINSNKLTCILCVKYSNRD